MLESHRSWLKHQVEMQSMILAWEGEMPSMALPEAPRSIDGSKTQELALKEEAVCPSEPAVPSVSLLLWTCSSAMEEQ